MPSTTIPTRRTLAGACAKAGAAATAAKSVMKSRRRMGCLGFWPSGLVSIPVENTAPPPTLVGPPGRDCGGAHPNWEGRHFDPSAALSSYVVHVKHANLQGPARPAAASRWGEGNTIV